MNNYYDKYGRIHHKPCINLEPSSNNGWIYTAYAHKVGVPVDMNLVRACFAECRFEVSERHDSFNRSPGKSTPPISRDEILGMVSLNLPYTDLYRIQNWNFSPFPIPRFSALSLIKQLWQYWGEISFDQSTGFKLDKFSFPHRNYFWQNNLDQLYRFAFSVPVQDRYFILKTWNCFKWWNPAHILYLTIAKIDAKLSPSGIRFLKYVNYANYNMQGLKCIRAMAQEFPADHPIRVKLGI